MSKLDWPEPSEAEHALWFDHYRALIDLRMREIVPRLAGISGFAGSNRVLAPRAVTVEWQFGDGMRLLLSVNFSDRAVQSPRTAEGCQLLYSSDAPGVLPFKRKRLSTRAGGSVI